MVYLGKAEASAIIRCWKKPQYITSLLTVYCVNKYSISCNRKRVRLPTKYFKFIFISKEPDIIILLFQNIIHMPIENIFICVWIIGLVIWKQYFYIQYFYILHSTFHYFCNPTFHYFCNQYIKIFLLCIFQPT